MANILSICCCFNIILNSHILWRSNDTFWQAFCRLKTALPWVPSDTKLSKLDTLRLASSYISHLREILEKNDEEDKNFHPTNLHLFLNEIMLKYRCNLKAFQKINLAV
ncbi:hypothetical protein B4U80_00073 [Leptotrombidium deliense]|uniref:BHLH domain-containing protein n=1 Tax=Leptotrombidium deliense TaxID=299467 RepID=A0A443SUE0_9ACAR|nr:hypothetical protein B4U80_00073 [Leptotrombidium deliense]